MEKKLFQWALIMLFSSSISFGQTLSNPLLFNNGSSGNSYDRLQIAFGWYSNQGYAHRINTRHHNTNDAQNAIDFYLWHYGQGISDMGNKHIMSLTCNGVGIGETAPTSLLNIVGSSPNIEISNTAETSSGIIFNDYDAKSTEYAKILFNASNYHLDFYIRSTTPCFTIDQNGTAKYTSSIYLASQASLVIGSSMNPGTNRLRLTQSGDYAYIDYKEKLYFRYDGTNYGIIFNSDGKIQAQEILVTEVNTDLLRSKEINVAVENVADYVLTEDYNLRSLDDVKDYIHENGHLPDVPAAEELESNGMNVAAMNNLLLQKIEELTLYVIELKEENEQLKLQMDNILQITKPE